MKRQLIALGICGVLGMAPASGAQSDEAPQSRPTSQPSDAAFDHSTLDALLRAHVDDGGWVDYAALKRASNRLDAYISSLAKVDLEGMSRDERLATLINAYNAFTLKLIVDEWPVKSITDLRNGEPWDVEEWTLAGRTVSLNQIEHKMIRPVFNEPRIHFALVCAAVGCPPLRNEAYQAAELNQQLAEQTAATHAGKRWVRHSDSGLQLMKIYDWYKEDFIEHSGSVVAYVASHVPSVREAIDKKRPVTISWMDYDWSINDVKNRR